MKKLILLLICIFLVYPTYAQVENYNNVSELLISYNLETKAILKGSSLNYLIADLLLVPLNSERQDVLYTNPFSNPTSEINKNPTNITYTWHDFSRKISLGYDSKIKTKNIIYQIGKTSFPITSLPQEYDKYLQANEIIDITPEIANKASEIVEGETDLYVAVFKLAEWVKNNIEYDLNTLTAEAALPSSWVLNSREGVCDEITSLFISFLRSVGIPARFVSGSVYSNIDYNLSNHGWAEVYFPGYGWIPYDVTFGQYGWIDPSHITLSRTQDAKVSSVKYTWVSSNLNLETRPVQRSIIIDSTGPVINPLFEVNLEVLKNNVGPGSYIPFKVTVKNPLDTYFSDSLHITKAPSHLEINQQQVLLRPNSQGTLYWIVKIPNDLMPNMMYSSVIEVSDLFGSTDEEEVYFSNSYEIFTKEQALSLIKELQEKEKKSYSENLLLTCLPNKPYYYQFEDIKINCTLQNTGNTQLKVNLCLENNCQNINLNIAEKKKITLNSNPINETKITATFDNQTLIAYVYPRILEKPDLKITGLNYPSQIEYGKDFNLTFILTSIASVKDIKIKINNFKEISLNKTKKAQQILLETNSKHFLSNKIKIKVSFKDEYNNKFEIKQEAPILVTNVPWYKRIIYFISSLFQ
jgi:transglutaminase-like putative cysteine protease